ncbi:MAG TPA: mannose-1-phosphate guanylyltransferase [Actinomycetales bacterium]|nr:mannose-1-phosphate guanylyltransferase [Actinomycetales bacterium]
MTIDGFRAIVPAGGAGTRLWPLSRAGSPKFLHDLTGAGRTLLQSTWDRMVPLTGPDGVLLVTGAAHATAVREQLPALREDNLLLEPSPRDSMAAIGLAAAVLARRDGDAVIGSFAADHVITGDDVFAEAVRQAVVTAREGYVVTLGITPDHPSTAFGYVRSGDSLGVEEAPLAQRAAEFVEKPDAETASRYVAGGGYRWNAGMFVSRVDVLLGHLAEQKPDLHSGLVEIALAWDTDRRAEVLDATWPGLEKIAIDHAIAEPVAAAGGVAVVPGSFGWDDVGDWHSLCGLLPEAEEGPRVLGHGDVVSSDAGGLVVPAGGRLVVVVGLDDVVVVDTPDALLVTSRARAQDVKAVVGRLRAAGRTDLL